MPWSLKAKHRCAVCWQWQDDHEEWLEHIEEQHGSILREFGFRICSSVCHGYLHGVRLKNEGEPRVPRARPEPQKFVAPDGTVYTPVRLPI